MHMTHYQPHIIWHSLGLCDYVPILEAMQRFTDMRCPDTADEIWTLEHRPIYTIGQAGSLEHILTSGKIPVLRSDRGGQATYHGPGQIIAYVLYDLQRNKIGIKHLVCRLEQAVIDLLANEGVEAQRQTGAPGIYVATKKIASLGLRVRKGRSFHGLSLNCAMDLEPFTRIVTCGNADLQVTQLADLVTSVNMQQIETNLVRHLTLQLSPTNLIIGKQ